MRRKFLRHSYREHAMMRGRVLAARVPVRDAASLHAALLHYDWTRPWHCWQGEVRFSEPREAVVVSVIEEPDGPPGLSREQATGFDFFCREYPRLYSALHARGQEEYAAFSRWALANIREWRCAARRLAVLKPGSGRVADHFARMRSGAPFTAFPYTAWLALLPTKRPECARFRMAYDVGLLRAPAFGVEFEADFSGGGEPLFSCPENGI